MSEKKALLVIDLQNDYLWDKRKSLFTYDTVTLVGNVNKAIDEYSSKGYDVIYIEHILPGLLGKLAGFSVRGTEGAKFYDGVKIISDLRFEKNKSDSFTSDTFRAHMEKQGYTEVVLCGIDECGCVGATAEGAARRGLKVVMLSSAIGSRFPNSKIEKRRHSLKALGVDYIG